MFSNYKVVIEPYSERHYIKSFQKKYKTHWDVTWRGLLEELKRFDAILKETEIADEIVVNGQVVIWKIDFRVHGTKFSRKKSGNRMIVAVHADTQTICVLLVFHKNDISSHNETATWKKMIREEYVEYSFCR
jgi:hypothetical protein